MDRYSYIDTYSEEQDTRAQISSWMKEKNQDDTDDNALTLCAQHGKLEWVKFFIAAGANVHTDNEQPLITASYQGYLDIVKELLKAGADVHVNNDCTLRYASNNGHQDVVKVLNNYMDNESKGIKESLNEHDYDYFVPFDEKRDFLTAVKDGAVRSAKQYISNSGVDPNVENGKALVIAVKNRDSEMVRMLLTAGADPHINDEMAIKVADYIGHSRILRMLKGERINSMAMQESLRKNKK
jgi:hypothetical protein